MRELYSGHNPVNHAMAHPTLAAVCAELRCAESRCAEPNLLKYGILKRKNNK